MGRKDKIQNISCITLLSIRNIDPKGGFWNKKDVTSSIYTPVSQQPVLLSFEKELDNDSKYIIVFHIDACYKLINL